MKRVWFIVVGLVVLFSLLFAAGEQMGVMENAFVEGRIEALQASALGRSAVALGVIGLLTVDLLLPVPSSIVMALSGKLLGTWWGGVASFAGAMLAAAVGYGACRRWGESAFRRLVGTTDRERVRSWFQRYGVYAIILSRPVPMLTEILSCLAGLSAMRARTFFGAALLGTLPICFVYSYVGSRGSLSDPWPAIWIALAIPAAGWLLVRWLKLDRSAEETPDA